MDAIRLIVICTLVLVIGIGPTQAQDDLPLLTPVTGTLGPDGSASWTFSGADGAMRSFLVERTTGTLDPVLTITSRSGNVVLANDDYLYPETTNALLEGITLPGTDTYTVTVTSFGSTSGAFELTMLPGYAHWEDTMALDEPAAWSTRSASAELVFGEARLAVLLSGPQEQAVVSFDNRFQLADHYTQVDIAEVIGAAGWQVGLVARQQDAANYYAYSVNDRGEWRFTVRIDDREQVLRDWSTHPAIIPGQSAFNLGLLANGRGFEFFYNGQLIGRLADATLPDAGQISLFVGTPATLGSEIAVQFQNIIVTTPLEADYVPDQLATGNSRVMLAELQRRRLVPPSGEMGLVIPESFVTFGRPGVNALLLGNQTFEHFALGATVSWEIAPTTLPAGCGLLFGTQDEDHYWLAYLDQTGAYGVSARDGDDFAPGIFGEDLDLPAGPQRLLVVAAPDQLLYYVNGTLVGTIAEPVMTGGIGNAVVNFEPASTSCQFNDTWVWTWD
jgi:hypothetical protein